MDKREKKRRLKAWASEQRREARAALPLASDQMKALFDMLDVSLPKQGCDHTRRLTEAWLAEHGHPSEPVLAWLESNGGYCDCEVLANSEEAWEYAIHESPAPNPNT